MTQVDEHAHDFRERKGGAAENYLTYLTFFS
jgi:hypothetical protein